MPDHISSRHQFKGKDFDRIRREDQPDELIDRVRHNLAPGTTEAGIGQRGEMDPDEKRRERELLQTHEQFMAELKAEQAERERIRAARREKADPKFMRKISQHGRASMVDSGHIEQHEPREDKLRLPGR